MSWDTTWQLGTRDGDQLSVPIYVSYSHEGVAYKTVGVQAPTGIVLIDRVSHAPERE